MIAAPDDWKDLLAHLGEEPWRAAHVVGTSDSGKTTFCAIQREAELEPLLACFARRRQPAIHRLGVPRTLKPRSRESRVAHRRERLGGYFRNAAPRKLGLDGVGLHGMIPADPDGWRDRLVALCDREGFVERLAIAEAIEEDVLRLVSPPFDPERIASVQVGSLRIDPTGRELES